MFPKDIKATWENNYFCDGPCDPQVSILFEIFGAFGYTLFLSKVKDACTIGPLFMCQSGKIVSVDLRNHNLTVTIYMQAFSNLTSLVNLNLGGNNLTGSIPHSLAIFPQLRLLDVSGNNLSGRVPEFSSKVMKLITTGNTLLGRGGGENATDSHHGDTFKTAGFKSVWIVGMYVYPLYKMI